MIRPDCSCRGTEHLRACLVIPRVSTAAMPPPDPRFRLPGARVRVCAGMCKGSRGVTTGDVEASPVEVGVTLVGVLLARRFKMIAEGYLVGEGA